MTKRTVVVRDGMNVVYEDGVLDSEMPIGDGVAKWFFPNGALKAEVPKVEGESHGTYREWHDNGQLAKETVFNHGKATGVVRNWNKEGSLERELEIVSDAAIHSQSYSEPGRIHHVFLWNGKPISKTKWLKKLEAAGFSKSELERRFPARDAPGNGADT